MAYEYKISTQADGVGGLVLLTSLCSDFIGLPAPLSDPAKAVDSIMLGNSIERLVGAPTTEWHWNFITSAARAALRAYCPDGISSNVYIRTLSTDGDGTWKNYLCVMVWPIREQRSSGRVIDFTLQFRDMELIP